MAQPKVKEKKVDFEFFQGDTFGRILRRTIDGLPVDLTGSTINFEVFTNWDEASPLVTLAIGSGITLIDADDGKFSFNMSKVQTRALPVDGTDAQPYEDPPSTLFVYTLTIELASGDTQVVMWGKLKVFYKDEA